MKQTDQKRWFKTVEQKNLKIEKKEKEKPSGPLRQSNSMEQSQQSRLFKRDIDAGVGGGLTSQQSTSSFVHDDDVVDDDDNDTSGDDTLIFIGIGGLFLFQLFCLVLLFVLNIFNQKHTLTHTLVSNVFCLLFVVLFPLLNAFDILFVYIYFFLLFASNSKPIWLNTKSILLK